MVRIEIENKFDIRGYAKVLEDDELWSAISKRENENAIGRIRSKFNRCRIKFINLTIFFKQFV